MDYESSIRIVEFTEAGLHLLPVIFVDDLTLEDTEYLSAHITTSDPFVVSTVEDFIVFITDNGEMKSLTMCVCVLFNTESKFE